MAKQPVNAKAAAKKASQLNTQKHKEARLQRHLKRHPNDEQSAKGFKGNPRKKPFVKGSAPRAKNAYRDEAGHEVEAPRFAPFVKQAK